ncbi:MAG: S1 RNA-binding domain-containing protein [Candidatus Taylorbacteria bacterium]|nr:S1 RNA-binding domain-containing protein [Candidatus Taylorbacteria bacterium]
MSPETAKKAVKTTPEMEAKANTLMGKLSASIPTPPSAGDLIEGSVIAIDKKGVFVDLPPFGTGIIFGREYILARDVIKKINIGDKVSAKIVDPSNKEGYIELSLKEARQALIWTEAEQAIAEKRVLELPIKEANKGGLIIEWQGIQGFLPASQLKPEHYPRVQDGDKDRILEELKKLVGTKLSVSIIGAFPKEGKLIFSEKNPVEGKDKATAVAKFKVGDEIEGKVTGMVDFGVFVKIDEGLEGLVHISEIDWALVEDPKTRFKVGDKVRVKVIEVKEGKVSLSIKALKPNPWADAAKKYKKDMQVKGVIIKFNRHGALASIEEGVAGLVHVSEFGSDEKLRSHLELGKVYPFKITLFDATNQKMTLSFAGEKKA